jgi:exopolyphosphatase/guanosine-5'-triphosphate,3'-diphosphate pyrophosphatase
MRAAVVDIGSNSIKLLVAAGGPDGSPAEVLSKTLEVRISAGIGSREPRLSGAGMARGTAAVAELVANARNLEAGVIAAVATSAVRDSSNGAVFTEMIEEATGIEVRILSGLEEAGYIGRGLTTDPALGKLSDFDVFDLGGGSLECLSFKNRAIGTAVSLPLGCVRLTEMLVPSPDLPFTKGPEVARHIEESLRASGFPFPVPEGFGVVGTGGTLTTYRAIDAARRAVPLDRTDPLVPVEGLRRLLAHVGSLGIEERRSVGGLSGARADVYPTALATLIALAELGGITAFHHSFRNLRWGIAAELLESRQAT